MYSCFLIRGRPFENSFENKMSLFTETVVSVYLYLLLCLTDFMGNANLIRDAIALTLVYIIGFAVFINLMIFAKIGFYRVKLCV